MPRRRGCTTSFLVQRRQSIQKDIFQRQGVKPRQADWADCYREVVKLFVAEAAEDAIHS